MVVRDGRPLENRSDTLSPLVDERRQSASYLELYLVMRTREFVISSPSWFAPCTRRIGADGGDANRERSLGRRQRRIGSLALAALVCPPSCPSLRLPNVGLPIFVQIKRR